MSSTVGHYRTEKAVIEGADAILKPLGLTRSGAIDLFLRQVIMHGGLPFEVKRPNALTREAIERLEMGEGKVTESVDQLFEELEGTPECIDESEETGSSTRTSKNSD